MLFRHGVTPNTCLPGFAIFPEVHFEDPLHILDPTLKLIQLNGELIILGGAVEHLQAACTAHLRPMHVSTNPSHKFRTTCKPVASLQAGQWPCTLSCCFSLPAAYNTVRSPQHTAATADRPNRPNLAPARQGSPAAPTFWSLQLQCSSHSDACMLLVWPVTFHTPLPLTEAHQDPKEAFTCTQMHSTNHITSSHTD